METICSLGTRTGAEGDITRAEGRGRSHLAAAAGDG